VTPEAVKLGSRVTLMEWLEGKPFAHGCETAADHAFEVGQLLSCLHGVAVKTGTRRLQTHLLRSWQERNGRWHLRRAHLNLTKQLLGRLLTHWSAHEVLLHGDLHPGNLIRTTEGLRAFDPYGFRGSAGYDLAFFAVSASAIDQRSTLSEVIRGYGSSPELVEDCFGFLALWWADLQTRAGTVTDFQLDLADELVRVGDPHQYLTDIGVIEPGPIKPERLRK
jgi:Ser/Thr protein kinase RdoA (MazF antagonist)